MICRKCKQDRPAELVSKDGNRKTNICKVCVNEQVKAHNRRNRGYPVFLKYVYTCDTITLVREIEWLGKKLEVALDEIDRRVEYDPALRDVRQTLLKSLNLNLDTTDPRITRSAGQA